MATDDFSPVYDGYVRYRKGCEESPPEYIDWNSIPWIWASTEDDSWTDMGTPTPYVAIRRGYAFFDTSSLPAGAVVTKVELNLYGSVLMNSARDTYFYQQAAQYGSYSDAEDLFDGLDDGSLYTQGAYDNIAALNTIDLGSQAVTDLNSHISWFGVGVLIDEQSPTSGSQDKVYYSEDSNTDENDYRPYLTVTYTVAAGNFFIMF